LTTPKVKEKGKNNEKRQDSPKPFFFAASSLAAGSSV
jgi:hypothetical protein